MAVVYAHGPAAATHGDQVKGLQGCKAAALAMSAGRGCLPCTHFLLCCLALVHLWVVDCVPSIVESAAGFTQHEFSGCCDMFCYARARHLKATTSAPTVLMAEDTEAATQRQVRTRTRTADPFEPISLRTCLLGLAPVRAYEKCASCAEETPSAGRAVGFVLRPTRGMMVCM